MLLTCKHSNVAALLLFRSKLAKASLLFSHGFKRSWGQKDRRIIYWPCHVPVTESTSWLWDLICGHCARSDTWLQVCRLQGRCAFLHLRAKLARCHQQPEIWVLSWWEWLRSIEEKLDGGANQLSVCSGSYRRARLASSEHSHLFTLSWEVCFFKMPLAS